MKRISYVFNCGYAPEEKGVMMKIISQCKAFLKIGFDVSMHQLNKFKASIVDTESMAFSNSPGIGINTMNKVFYYRKSVKGIIAEVASRCPDIIYVRDALWSFDLYSGLAKIAPVFVEVQSRMMDELKIMDKRRYYIEKFAKRSYFKDISGLVCITREISSQELLYNKKPVFILGNGISEGCAHFQPRGHSDGRISLVFIGAPFECWHGIDRLIESFLNSQIKDRFVINIIGIENIMNIRSGSIKFHGYITNPDTIGKILSSSDIGIGTLALFRKNMKEAAPLKVRQYLAAGLPVIIGYDDPDFDDNLPFVMKVSNDNSLLDFKRIEEFYYKTIEYRNDGSISGFASYNLSWDKKIKGLAAFMGEAL